ncbi:MAG: hypothetical protein E7373_02625 [Clostridiales bacterium]|nr:hypothetical protein [Clostridiales bacterium]
MQVLPRLKEYKGAEGKFIFPVGTTKIEIDIVENGCFVNAFLGVYNDYFRVTGTKLSLEEGKALIKASKISSDKKEYYEIVIKEDIINIFYADKFGLRNAIATIISAVEQDKKTVYIKCASIKDYPNYSHRGVLIDVARRFVPMDEFKMHIRSMGLCKYRYLHWHLSDGVFSYELKCYPEVNDLAVRRLYTQEEIKELVSYAESFGIESIPEIDVPAHCSYLIKAIPDIFCDIEEPRNTEKPISKYVACVSSEKTYEVITNIFKELCEIFKGEYFHIGGDELYFYDLEYTSLFPEWQNCRRCKALAKQENLETDLDIYIYFINKINKIVKSLGKKTIMFNDAVDISKPTKLDKDIIIHFWRVAMEDRGPVDGCSMQGFLDQGFKVINSYFPETYMCDFVREDKLKVWTPTSSPKVENGKENQIIGSELCAWGVHNHFDYSMLPILCYFSDRVWNSEDMEESEEIDRAFVRQTISHKIDAVNIFDILNSRIPPLNDYDKFFPDKVNKDLEKVEQAMTYLTTLYVNGLGEVRAIKGYITVLQELRNQIRKEQNLPMVDTTLWGFISESKLKKEGKMR